MELAAASFAWRKWLLVGVAAIALAACGGVRSRSAVPAQLDPALLELREVVESSQPGFDTPVVLHGTSTADDRTFYFDAAEAPFADGRHLDPSGARLVPVSSPDPSHHSALFLTLDAEGERRLSEWSRAHVGALLGIFTNGRLIGAPRVATPLGGAFIVETGDRGVSLPELLKRIRQER